MGTGGRGCPYLARSAAGGKPKLVGGGEGVAEISGACSGMGECGVAGSSAGGAGGCVAGGVADALRPPEVPLRATHEVSITLTPMLGGQRRVLSTRTVARDRARAPLGRPHPAQPPHAQLVARARGRLLQRGLGPTNASSTGKLLGMDLHGNGAAVALQDKLVSPATSPLAPIPAGTSILPAPSQSCRGGHRTFGFS